MVTPEQRLQSLETWTDTVMGAIRRLHEDNQVAHMDGQVAHMDGQKSGRATQAKAISELQRVNG